MNRPAVLASPAVTKRGRMFHPRLSNGITCTPISHAMLDHPSANTLLPTKTIPRHRVVPPFHFLSAFVLAALVGCLVMPLAGYCKEMSEQQIEEEIKKREEVKKAHEEELKTREVEKKTKEEQMAAKKATGNFQGLNFGLGVGVTSTFSNRQVRSAQVVNGTVRVDDAARTAASVLLESHYFFTNECHPLWAHGPFVGIKPGGENNQIIESIGLGWMWGFRHAKTSNSSWNIGVAGTITPNARLLGDGVSRNQPLPAGETEVRFKNATLGGVMVLVSFSWNSFE
jgi:hypothetical protein